MSQNVYLHSLLDPFNVSATVPDLNMTTSIPKSVSVTNNLTIAGGASASLLLLCTFHSKGEVIRVFAYDSATGYNYLTSIEADEDLSTSFSRSRFVSGGLKIQSATVTGTTYTLAGTVNAISYQDLPDISTLTYNTLSSYARNNTDRVGSIPVANGVVVLAHPEGDHDFAPFETANYLSEDRCVMTNFPSLTGAGPTAPFVTGIQVGIASTQTVFDTDLLAGSVPPNAWGRTRITGNVQLELHNRDVGTSAGDHRLDVYQTTVTAHPTTYAQVVTRTRIARTRFFTTIPTGDTHFVSYQFDQIVTIDGPTITRYDAEFVFQGTPTDLDLTVEAGSHITCYYYGFSDDSHGPGSLVALQELTNGQTVAIAGMLNYEAVPDAELARNIRTNYGGIEDTMHMTIAETMIKAGAGAGIKFVYTLPEYLSLQKTGYFASISSPQNTRLYASSFLKGLSKFFTSKVKPVMRDIALPLGTAVGAAFGQPAIGAAVGGIGRTLFSADAMPDAYHAGSDLYAAGDSKQMNGDAPHAYCDICGVVLVGSEYDDHLPSGPTSLDLREKVQAAFRSAPEGLTISQVASAVHESQARVTHLLKNDDRFFKICRRPDVYVMHGAGLWALSSVRESTESPAQQMEPRPMTNTPGLQGSRTTRTDSTRDAKLRYFNRGVNPLLSTLSGKPEFLANKSRFGVVDSQGRSYMAEIIVSLRPLVEDRAEMSADFLYYEHILEFQDVDGTDSDKTVYVSANIEEHNLAAVLAANFCPWYKIYVTATAKAIISDTSWAAALYCASMGLPYGPVVSGSYSEGLSLDIVEFNTPSMISEKFSAAKAKGLDLVVAGVPGELESLRFDDLPTIGYRSTSVNHFALAATEPCIIVAASLAHANNAACMLMSVRSPVDSQQSSAPRSIEAERAQKSYDPVDEVIDAFPEAYLKAIGITMDNVMVNYHRDNQTKYKHMLEAAQNWVNKNMREGDDADLARRNRNRKSRGKPPLTMEEAEALDGELQPKGPGPTKVGKGTRRDATRRSLLALQERRMARLTSGEGGDY